MPTLLCLATFAAPRARAVAATAGEDAAALGVQLLLIEDVREFPQATEVGAIRFACAQDQAVLGQFFEKRGARYRPQLVHKYQNYKACHVYYEQTIPGFRALPDNRPIIGLASGIDPASLVGGRKNIGDSLDVAREVLKRIPRPLDVTFTLTDEFERDYWPESLAKAFPDSKHHFKLIQSEAKSTHPWGQDFIKAGSVNGELRVLTPRRLFEGREEDGDLYRPLLEAMKDGPYVRSKLSWEGGDLQFIADPKDPSRTILFHGGASHDYWGSNLKHEESSYVLQVEFGADAAVDMSSVGPHADYLAAFVPEANLVLMAEPVTGDLELAFVLAGELRKMYGAREPDELRVLESLLQQAKGPDPSPQTLEQIRSRVRTLLGKVPSIEALVPEPLQKRLDAHNEQYCPKDPTQCYVGEGKRRMRRVDPDLMKAVYDTAADSSMEPMVAQRFLRLIESQLPNDPDTISVRIEEQVSKVRKLGFKIARVPYLYSPEESDWPGISYTNSLLFEKTLFVPAAGLGEAEEKIFRQIGKKLPTGYEVVPVYARFGLMNNGGVHCVFGIIREPSSRQETSETGQ
ncbi:MAG: hypothetical protein R2748_14640 [Bryobacterales bacterium]